MSLCLQGADVNVSAPENGCPPLSLAASNGYADCLNLLAESGAHLDAQTTPTGHTALHEAVLQGVGSLPCIELLLGLGANPKLRSADGLTPCDLALKLQHADIVACFATFIGEALLEDLCKHQPGRSLTL